VLWNSWLVESLDNSSRPTGHVAGYVESHRGREGDVSTRTLRIASTLRCMVASMDGETGRKWVACKSREKGEAASSEKYRKPAVLELRRHRCLVRNPVPLVVMQRHVPILLLWSRCHEAPEYRNIVDAGTKIRSRIASPAKNHLVQMSARYPGECYEWTYIYITGTS
jgi:hypothetical protein